MKNKLGSFKTYLGEVKVPPQKMVLDWVRAAKIIKLKKVTNAYAGLKNEPLSHDIIYRFRPVLRDETCAFVESTYDIPVLIIGEEMIECFKLVGAQDEEEFWPKEALEVFDNVQMGI